MSENNFDKLDTFMTRNVPGMSDITSRKINVKNKFGFLEYAIALGLSCIIGYTVIQNENRKLEHAAALTDMLEWDVTSDEDLLEVASLDDFDI